jgi:hypothetical protein
MKKIYSFIGVLILLLSLVAESSAQTRIIDRGPDDEWNPGQTNPQIRNGTIVEGTKFASVMIGKDVGEGCSGTMLTNTWAISANHCFGYEWDSKPNQLIVQYGGTRGYPEQTARVKRLVRHPTNMAAINPDRDPLQGVDLVLLELAMPLKISNSTTGFRRSLYTAPTSQLVGKQITCAGWGSIDDSGTWSNNLRQAVLDVASVETAPTETKQVGGIWKKIHVGDRVHYNRNASGQITLPGDSGCGCYWWNSAAPAHWELTNINVAWTAAGNAFGTSVADDTVRSWIAQNIPNIVKSSETLRPSASSWPGRVDLYWRGATGAVMHKWYPYGPDWSWDQNLGGTSTSAPGALSRGIGCLDVYWRGTDFHLKHKWYPFGPDWSWEQDLGGVLLSAPAAAIGPNGRMDVFWRGLDNSLRQRWYPAGSDWSGEVNFDNIISGIVLASAPAAVWRSDGILDVFWRGTDRRLKHIWYHYNGSWSQVEDLGGDVDSDPAAAYRADGVLDVFWKSPDGRLKHRWYSYGSGWSGVLDLGGGLATGPTASSRGVGQLDVFWRATDGRLKHIWFPYYGGWSWVQDMGGVVQ